MELLDSHGRVRTAAPANVLPYRGVSTDTRALYPPAKVRIVAAGQPKPVDDSSSDDDIE